MTKSEYLKPILGS